MAVSRGRSVVLRALPFVLAAVLVAGMVLGYALEEKSNGKAALLLVVFLLTQWLQLRAMRRLERVSKGP